ACGDAEDRPRGSTPPYQQGDPHQGAKTCDQPQGQRTHVIHGARHAQRGGPPLRYEQPHHVPHDHHEQAEVEEGTADPQQPGLVQLRGTRGPTELVVTVTPDQSTDQEDEHHVGQDPPQQGVQPPVSVHCFSFGPWSPPQHGAPSSPMTSAIGSGLRALYGSSPTSSAGGPCSASDRTASRSPRRS